MVSDLAKQQSDDTTLTERHIAFLLNKYRSYLLKQKYLNKAQEIPLSNYQTICADMTLVPAMAGCTYEQCMDGDNSPLLRSINKVDLPLTFSDTKVSLLRCLGKYSMALKDIVNLSSTIEKTVEEHKDYFVYLTEEQYKYIAESVLGDGSNALLPVYGALDSSGNPYFEHEPADDLNWLFTKGIESYNSGGVYFVWYDTNRHLYAIVAPGATEVNFPLYVGDLYYQTTCSEDVQTIISILKRKGVNATLVVIEQESGQCNETMFYTNAMRQFNGILVVDKERFNYVGHSKYYRSNGYATIGIDNHLYVKSDKDLSAYAAQYNTETGEAGIPTGKALITAIFENPDKAYEHSSCTYKDSDGNPVKCPEAQDGICDPWDREFPIEDALQTQLIALTMRDIYAGSIRPKDIVNNANDDLSSLEAYVRNALKRGYYKDVVDGDS